MSDLRVIVGMSGGVDSSVSAYILKKAGYEVIGITLKLFDTDAAQFDDVARVAEFLGIEWHLADYSEFFYNDVISYYRETYKGGKTPNPCVKCNRDGKFSYLYKEMLKHNATFIATGHYASKVEETAEDGTVSHYIRGDFDNPKDQSYYMCLVDTEVVSRLIFPLKGLVKEDVRKIASDIGLFVAEKEESQDACFLKGGDYRDYLKAHGCEGKKGYFVCGNERIQEHNGIGMYTVGQRRGLNIGGMGAPAYVNRIDIDTGDIYIGSKTNCLKKLVKLERCVFHGDLPKIVRVLAKVRYRIKPASCLLEIQPNSEALLYFDDYRFAPAPGQVGAVYDMDGKSFGRRVHTVGEVKAIVAISGGGDSASALALAVKEYGADKVLALTCVNQHVFTYEINIAYKVAEFLGVGWRPFTVVPPAEFKGGVEPPCFYCKGAIFGYIEKEAKRLGAECIIDGTNIHDKEEERPGMKVLKELGVRAILREYNIGKDGLEYLRDNLGIEFPFKFYEESCIATRIKVEDISSEAISGVEMAEDRLRYRYPSIRVDYFDGYISIRIKSGYRFDEEDKEHIRGVVSEVFCLEDIRFEQDVV